ncbi:MAG: hypothetical protein ACYSWO_28005 [Planctomycetota bacterium]
MISNLARTSDRRVNSHLACAAVLVALAAHLLSTTPARGQEPHTESDPFGFDFSVGWLEPPVHSHFSRRGTPMIHSFRTEPAFTRRDVLLDYTFRNETGLDEQEIAAEVEWPISRRLGLILELPYVFVDSDDEGAVEGFGNLAVSPRVLLAEYERLLLAFNLEVETTTGTTRGDIASDEVALAPSFSTWVDLDNWWALNAQSGIEYPTESGDSEFFLRSSLIHTFGSREDYESDHAHHEHGHASTHGLVSVILEADLALGLSGPEDGDWFAEGIVGVLVGLWPNADARVGYLFPLSKSQDLNNGFTAGLLWHFK